MSLPSPEDTMDQAIAYEMARFSTILRLIAQADGAHAITHYVLNAVPDQELTEIARGCVDVLLDRERRRA